MVTEPDGQTPIEHDPLAEEADLLTMREARARVTEELRIVRQQVAELERASPANDDLKAMRARREHLERTAARLGAELT
jgi:hypothetical protein